MSHSVSWMYPNLVIYHLYEGKVTLDDVIDVKNQTLELLHECPDKPVHVIVNTVEITEQPFGINAIRKATQEFFDHPSMGWMVVVNAGSALSSYLVQIITQLVGMDVKVVKSLEEAKTVLSRIEPRLEDIDTESEI